MIEFWKSKILGSVYPVLYWSGKADSSIVKMFFNYIDFADKPNITIENGNLCISTTDLELIYEPGSYFMAQANKLLSMSEDYLKENYIEVNTEPTIIKIDTKGLSVEDAIEKVKDMYDKLSDSE